MRAVVSVSRMGRTVIAEDGIENYGATLVEKKEFVAGLIFGQEISAQKSCVIHLARTPEPVDEDEGDNEHLKPSSKGNENKSTGDFQDTLIIDHAQQVSYS